ncbi:WXG100 family type VII secretion target, partial [Plantactinospora mayteni]
MGNVANLWDLKADPAALESLAATWKSQVKQLTWAADTISGAANRVIGSEAWAGETAERYDQHRRKLVADLDDCSELAGKVARALGECAQVLRHNQELLAAERRKLASIRSDGAGGQLTFYPADEQEKKLVDGAVQVANEIRGRVNQELGAQALVFNQALRELKGRDGKWSSRTLRMLNYNIQQGGGGNNIWDRKPGTDDGDFGALAQRIIDGKVDVATLQEVFRGGADELQRELNARAAPGEKWEVHFGGASEKYQWSNGGIPVIGGNGDFGNAVVVRTGNGVSTNFVSVPQLSEGDEGRSATKVEIVL